MKKTRVPHKPWKELTKIDLGGIRDNTVCLIRYGGFGDGLQISSIFPLLKQQGFRVCVNVTETCYKVLKHDPNIDELLIQDTNQIPVEELPEYWEKLSFLFTKFVNLNGVIEQGLLCLRGQDIYTAPHLERHNKLNKNYSEVLHKKAEVEYIFKGKFHPSSSEISWVKKQRKKMRLSPRTYDIVIALSGSSVHKAYPYMDSVIAKLLLKYSNTRIIMVGDESCKILEHGWEKENRIFLRSGRWDIRRTLAFAQQADMVLGPETGVLNAVSSEDVAKVCLLSHSSKENLTKHWVNSTPMYPSDVHCYPCHMMHYGFSNCNRDDHTGGAMCAASIDPNEVLLAIEHHRKLKYDISGIMSNS